MAVGILFGVLVDFRKIDGWVSWGVLFVAGRVLLGAFFGGVLLEVLVCKHCYLSLGSMLVYFICCFSRCTRTAQPHVCQTALQKVAKGQPCNRLVWCWAWA